MSTVIKVENLSKYYRLGLIGGGTLREDVSRWWASFRGKPDPLLKIGMDDHADREGGQVWALKDINFEVKKGEILGIIGGNGAGKSTLLKILSHITAPTEGRVKIRGRVGSLLEVGTGFHPELTGRENVYLNGTILGMSKKEVDSKLDEIIEFAEIAKFIDTPVKRYSSGMTVRLAFSVAAHLEPEILIVDEVLAVGDAAFQKKCIGKMGEVADTGRTILFVSHNMATIKSLCMRGILLNGGGVEFSGGIDACIAEYSKNIFRRTGTILSHLKDSVSNVEIIDINVNGSDADAIYIEDTNKILAAKFKIRLLADCVVSIEGFLHGSNGLNIAFYGPGHLGGDVFRLSKGVHEICCEIQLPRLLKGEYFISFNITNPLIVVYSEIPYCLELSVIGEVLTTGAGLAQGPIPGYQVLNGISYLSNKTQVAE